MGEADPWTGAYGSCQRVLRACDLGTQTIWIIGVELMNSFIAMILINIGGFVI